MKIYTKTGDTGETALYGSERVPKDHLRVEAYGAVDELNASLGWAITQMDDPEISAAVARIQNDCFLLGGDLATPLKQDAARESPVVPRLANSQTLRLEAEIDRFEEELTPLTNFILPGGSRAAAALHIARSVCRRAERRIVSLMAFEDVGPHIERYINRLSDHLFVLARLCNKRSGHQDVVWSRKTTQ
ncbi:MAG: cob(I)yrinic acid a,c-diamide adenosyltransferase [Capsulimonadaceae bacterium]|nr:cob(I)yrinic acid a,c-diamide adenosyltransferase [Capsulimonadaceae bacterium]